MVEQLTYNKRKKKIKCIQWFNKLPPPPMYWVWVKWQIGVPFAAWVNIYYLIYVFSPLFTEWNISRKFPNRLKTTFRINILYVCVLAMKWLIWAHRKSMYENTKTDDWNLFIRLIFCQQSGLILIVNRI